MKLTSRVLLLLLSCAATVYCNHISGGVLYGCRDGLQRVPYEWRCNGQTDCMDGSDEIGCDCEPHEWYCNNGECIDSWLWCDKNEDCSDGSDELSCPSGFYEGNCSINEFKCERGACIRAFFVCDGEVDCWDATDERNCSTECAVNNFTCANGQCIPINWVCDTEADCEDGSDEEDCDGTSFSCGTGFFNCTNTGCINVNLVCDGSVDCPSDSSDEDNCPSGGVSCYDHEFRCADPEYGCIPSTWVCDGFNDCGDFSDETGCEGVCQFYQFECTTGGCANTTSKCDGVLDCRDGSDEFVCPYPPPRLQCTDEQYTCLDGQQCIDVDQVCDDEIHCNDGSDELSSICTASVHRSCSINNGDCDHFCFEISDDHVICTCRRGYQLSADWRSCHDINECDYPYTCSQYCENMEGGHNCTCADGYMPHPTVGCKATGPQPKLILANHEDIRQYPLYSESESPSILVRDLHYCIALDYHYERGYLYWTDVSQDVIMRSTMDGDEVTTIISNELSDPGGLAVDWVNDKLYWTDSGTSRIEVSTINGTNRTVLFSTELSEPRAIVLDPEVGYMFWTDWGKQPKIERASMDGSNRMILHDIHVVWPNALTVDYVTKAIYWGDAKFRIIESSFYDGSHRRPILTDGVRHVFALSLFEDTLYWSEWETRSVFSTQKGIGRDIHPVEDGATPVANVTEIDTDLFRPHDVHVVHPLRQKRTPNPCEGDNGGCEYICLLSASAPEGYSCRCPPGIEVAENGKNCKPLNLFLLFAHYTDIRRVSLDMDIPVDVILPLANVTGALDLDWDDRTDQLFWTDLQQNTINVASLFGTNQRVLLTDNIESPAGLAVDWLSRKLYWTDDAEPERIEVAELDGSNRAILVHDRMDKPRDIIVYPTAGLMFWTDWGKYPKIERANLDGTDRVDIVSSDLHLPNGLAIDFEVDRLYWCDGEGWIEYSNFDGSDRVQLLFNSTLHPFGMALLGDWIYFTDWETDSLFRVDKLTGQNRDTWVTGLNRPFDVHVYHTNRTRPADHPCWTDNGGCSHLCLTRPSEAGGLEAACVCPTGYTLMENGKTCNEYIENYLFFPTENQLRQISLDTDFLANTVLPVDRVRAVSSVAVDIRTDDYYWADTLVSKIFKAPGNGGDPEVFIGTSILRPESMALDWIGRNLFWADSELGRIEVAQLERGSRHVLFSTDLRHVNALDIDLKSHRMFWIDAGDQARSIPAKIETATMDGLHRRAIITTNLGQPKGIAIDNFSGVNARIYWTDALKGTIESATYEGADRIHVIVTPQDAAAFPLGITVSGDYLFWTDVASNSVHRALKRDGTEELTVVSNLPTVSDITLVSKADLRRQALFAHGCDVEGQGCSDICLPNVATSIFTCACPTGLRLMDDDMTCRKFPDEYVLVSTRTNIRRVSLDTEGDFNDVTLMDGLYDVLVLDYLLTSAEDGIIIYGDSVLNGIFTANLNGTDRRLIISNVNQTEGLAVDWINRNVYWTEVGTQTLSVASLDGRARKTLIRDIDKPRAIALHPKRGLMFWTDWGRHAKIELATMDGSLRQVVVEESIHWPNGLAIDRQQSKIYWVDGYLGRERLESCDFNGGRRTTIVHRRTSNNLAFPFGLAFFRGFVFWTDWDLKGLYRKRVGDLAGSEVLIQHFVGAKPFQPIVVSTQYPREGELSPTGPCSVDNGGCPYLCLPYDQNRRICACPDDLLGTNLCSEIDNPITRPLPTAPPTTVTTEEETTTTQSPTTPPSTPPIIVTDPSGQNYGGASTTTQAAVTSTQLSSTEWFMLVFGILSLLVLIAMLVVGCLIVKWIRDRTKSIRDPAGTVRMQATNPHYCTSKFEGPVPLSKLGEMNPINTTKPDKVIGNLLPKHLNNAPRRCSSPTAANLFVEKSDVFVIPEPQRRKRPKAPRTCSISVVPLLEDSSPSPPMSHRNSERIPDCSSAPIPKQENTAKDSSKKTVRFDADVPLKDEPPPLPRKGVRPDMVAAKPVNKEVPRPISVSESDSDVTVSTDGMAESERPLIKSSTTSVPPTAPHTAGDVDTSESSC